MGTAELKGRGRQEAGRAAGSRTPDGGTASGSFKEDLGERQHLPLGTSIPTPVGQETVRRQQQALRLPRTQLFARAHRQLSEEVTSPSRLLWLL